MPCNTRPMRHPIPTGSRTGHRFAISGSMARRRRVAWRRELLGIRTSTITEDGRLSLLTGRSGFRTACPWAGRLTALGTGHGLLPGAGHGSMTHRGASLPSTTAAGSPTAVFGAGLRDPFMLAGVLTTLPPWWGGLGVGDGASGSRLDSALAADAAGSRWDGVNLIIPGTTA